MAGFCSRRKTGSWPVSRTGIFRSILISVVIAVAANSGLAQTTARDFCNRGVTRQKKGDLDGAVADYTRAIELNPQNVLAYNNRGLVKIAKGDLEGALADYDRALQISPRNFEVRTNRGVARQRSGDLDGAMSDYNIALKLYHKYWVALSARATLKLAQDDLDGALADANLALDNNPKDASAYNTRGLVEKAKGNADAATADFNHAIKLDPKYARNFTPAIKPSLTPPPAVASQPATSNAVNAPFAAPVETKTPVVEQEKPDVAKNRDVTHPSQPDVKASRPEPDFAPPIEVEPQNIAAAYDRDLSKNKKAVPTPTTVERPARLEPTAKPVTVAENNAATSIPRETMPHAEASPTAALPPKTVEGSNNFEVPNPSPSVAAGSTIVPAPPIEPKKVAPSEVRSINTPKAQVTAARADHSGSPEPTTPAISIEQNVSSKAGGDLTLAMPDRNQAAEPQMSPPFEAAHSGTGTNSLPNPVPTPTPPEREPITPDGYQRRADFRRTVGDLNGAMSDYNHAIGLNPRYAPAFNGRGNIKRTKHDYDGALADYNRAIEIDGGNSYAYYNRALTKQSKGDLDGALADFNPAVRLDPKNPAIYHSRGAVRQLRGDLAGALTDYTRAIELDPKDTATLGNRASVYYSLRQWDAALKDYDRFFELSNEGQDYPHFYVWLIRARSGQREAATQALSQYMEHRATKTDWCATLGSYLIGTTSEPDLLSAATSSDKKKEDGQLCEAWFYIGMRKLIDGDKTGAEEAFNKSLDTKQRDYTEYQYARAELKALH